MDSPRTPIGRLAIVIVVMVVMPACGDGASPVASTTTSEVVQEQDDGIPEEFPQPPDPEERDVLVLTAEDIQVQWEVGMTAEEAVAFYAESLPEEGWTISSRREGGDSTRFAINGHGWDGAVTILGGDPVKVLVQLGLTEV